jgi:hypothetical protein
VQCTHFAFAGWVHLGASGCDVVLFLVLEEEEEDEAFGAGASVIKYNIAP